MSHRANLSMSIVRRNSNRGGIVTTTIVGGSSRKDLKSGTILRVKSGGRRRSSALSQRSTASLKMLDSIPQNNEAANKLYDKNVGKQFDKFK